MIDPFVTNLLLILLLFLWMGFAIAIHAINEQIKDLRNKLIAIIRLKGGKLND